MSDAEARAVEVEPGRTLRAMTGGQGAPSALYDAGAFGIYADGANVVRALAERGVASVAYTRAGLSGSDPGQGAPTPDAHVADMLRLLGALGQDGPVTLIGHSMAGFRLHRLAELHPQRVQRLVLVDAMVPGALPSAALHAFAASLRPVERTLPAFCRTANAYPNAMRLSGQERADKLTSVYAAAHLRATRLEVAEAARAPIGTDHGAPMTLMPSGRVARGSEALAERTGAHLIDMSSWGHASVLNPEGAAVIADAAAPD